MVYNKQFDEKEQYESAFNIAVRFLEGIHLNLEMANYYYSNENPDKMRRQLNMIYNKAYPRMLNAELNDLKKIKEAITDSYVNYIKYGFHNGQAKKNATILLNNYFNNLSEYERYLIKVLDRLGWLVPTRKSVLEAMKI